MPVILTVTVTHLIVAVSLKQLQHCAHTVGAELNVTSASAGHIFFNARETRTSVFVLPGKQSHDMSGPYCPWLTSQEERVHEPQPGWTRHVPAQHDK